MSDETSKKDTTTNRHRLTKTFVEKLQYDKPIGQKDPRVTFWDDRLIGFGVRLSSKHKTYFVVTRIKGRVNEESGRPLEIRETIGRVGIMRHDDAEVAAKKILEDAAIGITPDDLKNEKEQKRKIEQSKNISLEKVLENYLADNKHLKDSTKIFYQDSVDVYFDDWKKRPIREITAEEIKERYEFLSVKIKVPARIPIPRKSRRKSDIENGINDLRVVPPRIRTNGPGIANGALKTLRALMHYTIKQNPGVMSINPVSKMMGKSWNKLKPREKYITPDQLPAWYKAVSSSDNDTMRDALLLLFFTGLRSESEGFALKWSDIDWTAKLIVFRDTKNHTTLTLPMTKQTHEVLNARKENRSDDDKKTDFVFPSKKSKSGHIEDIRKELGKANTITNLTITPHDLRRTFTTYLHQCSVSMITIKSLVNHVSETPSSDITADYIQVTFRDRKRAIRKVNNYMIDIIEGRYKPEDDDEDDF